MSDPAFETSATVRKQRAGSSSIANWLRIDRPLLEGLHFLRLAADPSWIVRKDLRISLRSSTHAEGVFSVDIDLERLVATLPESFGTSGLTSEPLWVPILRLPTTDSLSQRVSQVTDGNQQVLPVMPSTDVRFRLSAALAWMFLSGCFRPEEPLTLGEISRLQSSVHERIYDYLGPNGLDAFDLSREQNPAPHLEIALQQLRQLAARLPEVEVAGRNPADRFAHLNPEDGPPLQRSFRGALAETLRYCRNANLIVAGVTDRTASRISCELLPSPLRVNHHAKARWVYTFLGFDFTRPRYRQWPDALQLPLHLLRPILKPIHLAIKLIHRPRGFHFQFAVPEVSALNSTHVTVETQPDVAIDPAVLYHDHIIDPTPEPVAQTPWVTRGPNGRLDRSAQAYSVQDWISLLLTSLDRGSSDDRLAALGPAAGHDLQLLRDNLRERIRRLKLIAPSFLGETDDPSSLPTIASAIAALETTEELQNLLAESTSPFAEHKARTCLTKLSQYLEDVPHLELTPDDDPREHVAHFHTQEAPSLTPRDRDRRPVVHGVLRASALARQGYVRMAFFTCGINALLMVLSLTFLRLALDRGIGYNSEALVALLLLVPGVSATLLGRIAGDTIRFVVLERSVRLVVSSPFPPGIAAAILAVFWAYPTDDGEGVGRPEIFDTYVLWPYVFLTGLSVCIAMLATIEYLRPGKPSSPRWTVSGRVVRDPYGSRAELKHWSKQPHPEHRASWYRAEVDTRRVLDLASAMLFQAERPSRRFMTWITFDEDQPGDYLEVVDAVEKAVATVTEPGQEVDDVQSPNGSQNQDAAAPTEPPLLTIESSAAHTVFGGSSIVAIVSGKRYKIDGVEGQAEQAIASELEQALHKLNRSAYSAANEGDRSGDSVVDEIDEERDYFLYSAPRFVDAVVAVPAEQRPQLAWLIRQIWGSKSRAYRISYFHCPAKSVTSPADSDGALAVMKLGLGFDRHLIPLISASLLEIGRTAQRIPGSIFKAHDRRCYPEPTVPAALPKPGFRPLVASSAGPGTPAMMERLMSTLYLNGRHEGPESYTNREQCQFVSGSLLTAGGYVSRTFRFDISDDLSDQIRANDDGDGYSSRLWLGSDRRNLFSWRLRWLDTAAPVIPSGNPGNRFHIWVRWQLVGEDLSGFLQQVQKWGERPHPTSGSESVSLNLEYLNNRVNNFGQINGKARFEATFDGPTGLSIDKTLEHEARRSLYAFLVSKLRDRLNDQNCFIQISDEEPRRPALSFRRDSEFNSY